MPDNTQENVFVDPTSGVPIIVPASTPQTVQNPSKGTPLGTSDSQRVNVDVAETEKHWDYSRQNNDVYTKQNGQTVVVKQNMIFGFGRPADPHAPPPTMVGDAAPETQYSIKELADRVVKRSLNVADGKGGRENIPYYGTDSSGLSGAIDTASRNFGDGSTAGGVTWLGAKLGGNDSWLAKHVTNFEQAVGDGQYTTAQLEAIAADRQRHELEARPVLTVTSQLAGGLATVAATGGIGGTAEGFTSALRIGKTVEEVNAVRTSLEAAADAKRIEDASKAVADAKKIADAAKIEEDAAATTGKAAKVEPSSLFKPNPAKAEQAATSGAKVEPSGTDAASVVSKDQRLADAAQKVRGARVEAADKAVEDAREARLAADNAKHNLSKLEQEAKTNPNPATGRLLYNARKADEILSTRAAQAERTAANAARRSLRAENLAADAPGENAVLRAGETAAKDAPKGPGVVGRAASVIARNKLKTGVAAGIAVVAGGAALVSGSVNAGPGGRGPGGRGAGLNNMKANAAAQDTSSGHLTTEQLNDASLKLSTTSTIPGVTGVEYTHQQDGTTLFHISDPQKGQFMEANKPVSTGQAVAMLATINERIKPEMANATVAGTIKGTTLPNQRKNADGSLMVDKNGVPMLEDPKGNSANALSNVDTTKTNQIAISVLKENGVEAGNTPSSQHLTQQMADAQARQQKLNLKGYQASPQVASQPPQSSTVGTTVYVGKQGTPYMVASAGDGNNPRKLVAPPGYDPFAH